MNNKNKTVVRSMDILNLFIEHTELSFQEIINLSGIPKTSVYRMIRSFEEMGFLEKGSDAKYRLGLLFLKFGHLVSMRLDIRKIAYPFMQDLHNDVKEAINLIVREGNEAIYIEKIDTKQKVRLYTAIGRKSPLYAGACSRSILSFLPDAEIKAYIETEELKPFAQGTITDKDKLYETIQQARMEGYTISHSELENHTSAVAAPIFNHLGEVVAGISIAGIEANYKGENVENFKEKVKKVAEDISRQLGYIKE
ncbi:IclR family transcriptional regulator [Schinkia azotoformans]|uniref:Transcriptional regulator KipR n=1 Tax=Schinkia azotoformans LMG 9581 TaxID=1131731 RepID=K6DU47_SCHAZ|nr:IclR family transcriptional regulator [Schinkia azotoformans]EKN64321.1 transcriptional regulator KipR [Schinkia azotoformans LMG 9581]MEC1637970.1 IclR family transcriptional regulator [Schinkia azotoformans]MEC1714482.1 IclR family transcriptional regulator [Schinkia azotoformans]MEC1721524.1 IclR family transcriptional regulator [Schinkia azotoformans]MEC1740423.1 IclR family transcriptional regulator [Schinkia azotoformans]